MTRSCALLCCALTLIGCTPSRFATVPMDTIDDLLPGAPGERVLLVMLPGAYDVPQDFVTHGFIETVRERALPIDVVAVDSHAGYFTSHTIVDRLHQDVVVRARSRGYQSIWFLGISLGGYGSLLYAMDHAQELAGIIVLAPYLGTRGVIAEIEHDGGLAGWVPGEVAADDHERRLLVWLKQSRSADAKRPPIYLGYGADDRFAAAHRMLAARLPPEQVWVLPGGHDWPTWKALWDAMLDAGLLARVRQR